MAAIYPEPGRPPQARAARGARRPALTQAPALQKLSGVPSRGSWLLAVLPAAAIACAAPPPACPLPPPTAPRAALLWRVERTGAGVVWLFGTIHDAGAAEVPAVAWRVLDGAVQFASELGADEPDPHQLVGLARLPWGQVLDRLLPADDWWDLVEAMLGAMTEDELRHARPWFALVKLHARMAHAPMPSMDVALTDHAGKLGIAVDHLESWRDQLAALDASVGVTDLSQAIHDRKAVACQVAQLRAAYRTSDVPALARMLLDPVHGDRLLAERNRRWAPLIERYLEHGGGFVAVGLGHLLGDSGLPAMLEREGYRVTREAP
jgi:uncharacterized protein YbaP (TraB family)